MEKKTDKIYQHFVPKFYLRLFSNDDKSIGSYLFKYKKYIASTSFDSIGGSKYLYGKDGIIEDWFSNLEGTWNQVLRKIIYNNNLDIDYNEYFQLLSFIYLSDARSKTNANLQDKFINELAITTFNIDKDTKQKFKYSDKIACFNIPNFYSIDLADEIIPLFFDLNLVLIINKTNNQFITSDCIVNKYNQFLLEKGYKRGYGYGTIGFECFVPISPYLCLCLYDNNMYETKAKNDIIIVNDCKEIYKLNKLFLYNSDNYIFYNNQLEQSKINILLKQTNKLDEDENTIFKSNDNEFIMKIGSRCINKNFDLNIIKTNSVAKKTIININTCAPQRPYIQILEKDHNDATSNKLLDKIGGKKFYLYQKDKK